jgi:hypothetical protein
MITYHWNGEYWYKRNWSILKRIRHWIIWIGGWEKVNSTGWEFFTNYGKKKLKDPTPITLFGHFITIQPFGFYLSFKRGYFVVSRSGIKKGQPTQIYLSPNGTPQGAICWFHGTSKEVINSIKN